MIILLAVAAVLVSTPIAAAALVTFASRREESAHTLCRRPPGRLTAAARQLLGFHAYGLTRLIRPRIPRPRPAPDDSARPLSAPRS